MAASEWVFDVTDDTFAAEVAERSKRVPVVVDFWAPWCGPCRQLAPLLVRVVSEQNGAVVLAKVNTDENPGLAQQFAGEGIPAVYAVKDGAIVNQFVGLLPEAAVREFVAGLIPSDVDKQVTAAFEAESRDPKASAAAYRAILTADAKHEAARVGLARVLLATEGNEAEAEALVEGLAVGDHADEAERLRAIVQLRGVPHDDDALSSGRAAVAANADDAEARLRLGAVLAARGEYVPALDVLLEAAELDRPLARSKVRELMVRVFQVIGSRSETADDYRRRLQSLLY